ncbi:hypothetical protein [Rhodanobacter sp. OK091]|uniref:hypothetical protein n=1 Tax=Rhodanobacter sp. OK091 TaxID=1881037 RepID=UPI000915367B|nr:hypothetical protein [Rhodanobacter sp. OK091]SHL71660.1 hypothetical protein SAMN05428972_0861 [Rhodanobacter sp. OK091]
MKLSEKTLELNICAQVSQHVGSSSRLLWFGLTQKQEARAGFDACTKLGGRLLIFQFKASNRVLRSRDRVFMAPHNQLLALRHRAGSHRRSIFYAFPLVGTTAELRANSDLVSQTWLVDVTTLSSVGAPTKSDGSLRKNNCHNVYVKPGKAVFHSDPVIVEATDFRALIQQGFPGADGINWTFEGRFEPFWEFAREFSAGARGLVLW